MNVALVGTGYIAGRHAVSLREIPDVHIVGHVDVTIEAAQAAATEHGGRAYTAVADLLAHEQVDAVWICVPPFAHGSLEQTLIDRNIPIYIEKPLGVDLETPRRLAKAIAGRKLITSTGYYWRVMDAVPELKQFLAARPPRLIRAAWHGSTPPAPWWRREAKSGGQINEQATHLFDIVRYLVGEAEVVSAAGLRHDRPDFPDMDIADVTAATLSFPGAAALGVFTATSVLPKTTDVAVEFYCEGAKVTLEREGVTYLTAAGETHSPNTNDPLFTADRAFIAAIANKDPGGITSDYADGLATHELCARVNAAAQSFSLHTK